MGLSSSAVFTPPQAIGRFKPMRLLGRGSQSEVWLAYDPHLDRQVAIKTVSFAGADRITRTESLLKEARLASRLSHPHIIPLYDAGEHAGQPYLVFEYVEGRTLAQVLREEGPLPAARAAEITLQVLDAIASAHAQGIVHRDLKPSNILLDAQGLARVMDFGIASPIAGAGAPEGGLLGTPAYMAPEYLAGGVWDVRSDLYAVGLILYEMLTGEPAIRAVDLNEILKQAAAGISRVPSAVKPGIDERLDDIVGKALAREPAARFADALQMRQALEAYLQPAPAAALAGGARQSTLEFLLRRMRLKSDFPALSEAISTINRIAASDTDSVSQLSNAILKDFGLTNKLLKLVNSVSFYNYGGGNIGTVSRAVVILGFSAVRNLAMSLVLFENLQNKTQAAQLKEEFVRVLFSGMVAREMAGKAKVRDGEEAFICAMFHHLGRMLCLFYFPEEAEAIRNRMTSQKLDEDSAAIEVLGLSFEELGMGIARSWGLPETIIRAMHKLPAGRVHKAANPTERLRVLAAFANELAAVIAEGRPETRGAEIERLSQRFGESISLNARHLAEVVTRSLEEVTQFSGAVNGNFGNSAFARDARQWLGQPNPQTTPQEEATAELADTVLNVQAGDAVHPARPEGRGPTPEESQRALLAGLQEISNSLVNEALSLNDILRMILETMYSGMGFHRVLFCVREGRENVMQGKFGFGEGVQALARSFRFPIASMPDVFHVALEKNVDILITDIDDPKIAARIPTWYRQAVSAKTFVIFPVVVKGKPVGLIYADKPRAGDIVIPEQLLGTLKALRNQAVLAIRQSL
jgi:serine/threonine protein kinase